MSKSVNDCKFIGRLGKDPETREFASGGSVASFSIACSDSWKDKNTGEQKEQTEWINIDAFNQLGEVCAKYLSKGDQVYISGQFKTRKWEDQSGNTRYSTSIRAREMMMLTPKRDGERPAASQEASGQGGAYDEFDEDIPF